MRDEGKERISFSLTIMMCILVSNTKITVQVLDLFLREDKIFFKT